MNDEKTGACVTKEDDTTPCVTARRASAPHGPSCIAPHGPSCLGSPPLVVPRLPTARRTSAPHRPSCATIWHPEDPSSATPRPNMACSRRRHRRFTNTYSFVMPWRSIGARSAARLRRTVGRQKYARASYVLVLAANQEVKLFRSNSSGGADRAVSGPQICLVNVYGVDTMGVLWHLSRYA